MRCTYTIYNYFIAAICNAVWAYSIELVKRVKIYMRTCVCEHLRYIFSFSSTTTTTTTTTTQTKKEEETFGCDESIHIVCMVWRCFQHATASLCIYTTLQHNRCSAHLVAREGKRTKKRQQQKQHQNMKKREKEEERMQAN